MHYIGTGGAKLQFSKADDIGARLNSTVNPHTFATLTNVSTVNGTTLLRSELHTASNESSVISCSTIDIGTNHINFDVLNNGIMLHMNTEYM